MRDRVTGIWTDGSRVLLALLGERELHPPLSRESLPDAGDDVEVTLDADGRVSAIEIVPAAGSRRGA